MVGPFFAAKLTHHVESLTAEIKADAPHADADPAAVRRAREQYAELKSHGFNTTLTTDVLEAIQTLGGESFAQATMTGKRRASRFRDSKKTILSYENLVFPKLPGDRRLADSPRDGFTHKLARWTGWLGLDVVATAEKLATFITHTPGGDEVGFFHYINDFFVCDYDQAMSCADRDAVGVTKGLATSAVVVVLVFFISGLYLPRALAFILRPVAALTGVALAIATMLYITYGVSPACFTRRYGNPFFALPECLMDDIYDVLDIYLLPRRIDWGEGLVSRADGLDASGANACFDHLGFGDGFAAVAYVIQRLAGNDFREKYPLIQYLSAYPLDVILGAFRGVELEPGDLREHCFWIALPNLLPAILLFALFAAAQLSLLYIAWVALAAAGVLSRDVKNLAVYYFLLNEDIRDQYVEQTS